MDAARRIIKTLLAADIAAASNADADIHRSAGSARAAHAYLNAANALLAGFGALYNEMIEHPDFVALRRFARRFPV